MALKQVRFIRGDIRRTVLRARLHLVRILNYDGKQIPGSFLTPSQRTDLSTSASDLLVLLNAKKFV